MKKKIWLIAAVFILALAAVATVYVLRSRTPIMAEGMTAQAQKLGNNFPAIQKSDFTPVVPDLDFVATQNSDSPAASAQPSTSSSNTTQPPTSAPQQTPTQSPPPTPAPTPTPEPTPAPALAPVQYFDAGTVLSSVRAQVGGFMTYLDGPGNGMGYFDFDLGTHLSQDKIIADLVSAFSGEASRGNIYFDVVYLGEWGGNHQFQCYRAM